MKNIKGVIFDLDGVLVDTAKFHFLAWRKLAGNLGIDFSEKQNEALKGLSRDHSFEKILSWGNIELSKEEYNRQLDRKNQDYLARIGNMSETDLLPGTKEILDYLTLKKVPFALGSASRNAEIVLRNLKIYDRFAAIVDGNHVERPKPDPEVFLLAAKKLGRPPENCVVFEDSQAGVQAANSAGMLSIGIGDQSILNEADHNFSDFTELTTDFLGKLIFKT